MKKIFSMALAAILAFGVTACGSKADETTDEGNAVSEETDDENPSGSTANAVKVGVSMPDQTLRRWSQDGKNIKAQLEAVGYDIDVQYAGNNDVGLQVAQIENMIDEGAQILVIAPVEGASLAEVLKDAKDSGIPVIAYDRLIMNSDAVTYYATFDNYKAGRLQGAYIRDALKLDSAEGPFNIELFTVDSGDNNVNFFWAGAMDVLQPFIDSGKLVVPSGQTKLEQCVTPGAKADEAEKRMRAIIAEQGYSPSGKPLAAALASNDAVANGVTRALLEAGFERASGFPIITGQDCDVASVKNILAGTQAMSVFKDTRALAAQVVNMVNSIATGSPVDINDTRTYDNGAGVIPAYLCEPVNATADNYEALLIDSGYYARNDIS
ncbi:MAG: sugar-binding protein [Clostridiales bacterium]|nr:sugar-binding protein [Clostridiales bacterium]